MYVKSITIENLRCFRNAALKLQYLRREERHDQEEQPRLANINLLVGNNGTGKTTALRALALATLSPVMPQAGFLPYRLVRRTDKDEIKESNISAEVLLHAQDLNLRKLDTPRFEKMSMRIEKRSADNDTLVSGNVSPSGGDLGIWQSMYEDKSPAFLVVGYGATRRVEEAKNFDVGAQQKSRLLRYRRVAGLFESHIALVPLSFWLPSFQKENPGRYKQVVNLIDQLLPEEATFSGEYKDEAYLIELNGVRTPFEALSDGYRAYIGWIADLLYHVCMGAPSGAKLVDTVGLVLVDEIDLHLHPEWQRSVTASLSVALPSLQFVFTTHSPIVVGSLNKENIFVMESESSGDSSVRQYRERIYGLDAEEVLLSSYFNLKTTRAESFTSELRELSGKAGQGDMSAALAYAEKLAEATPSSEPASSSEDVERPGRRKRLVFLGRLDRVLSGKTQTVLLIVAGLLLSFWFVSVIMHRTFDGYIHAFLGGTLIIMLEITALILSDRSAK